jgi:hypothetical protein
MIRRYFQIADYAFGSTPPYGLFAMQSEPSADLRQRGVKGLMPGFRLGNPFHIIRFHRQVEQRLGPFS